MDIVSYFNCIPDEFLKENSSDYDVYLDCLTLLGEGQKLSKEETEKLRDRFTDYVINEWINDFNKEME